MDTSNPLLKRYGALSSTWAGSESMSLQGVINKTGVLLLLCMGAAAFGWVLPEWRGPLMLVGIVGGLIACLVGTFRPATASVEAPIYAVLVGLVLGWLSCF